MSDWAVKAEYKDGSVVTLRGGFPSREEAEDHPVKLSLWSRVWVEPCTVIAPERETLPELPWDWIVTSHPTANGSFHTYIVDATGRKIAAVWGRGKEKRITAQTIVDAVNGEARQDAA